MICFCILEYVGPEQMKKQVGFLGRLALSVGFKIGGSLFGLTTVAAGLTGPSLPLDLLVSGLPILLAVLPYALMASAAPTTAGSYRYMQLLIPQLALVVVLSGVVYGMISGLPLMSQIFGLFFQAILPVDPIFSSLVVLTVFYLVNLVRIRSAVWGQLVLGLFIVSALMLYSVQGAAHFNLGRSGQLVPQGIGGLIAAAERHWTLPGIAPATKTEGGI